jgi:lincosamide nucleotidyltransferase A/C/D/E
LAQRIKSRVVEMPADLVPDLMSAMEEAGVQAWVAGGWGVDALLGEQTRPHQDLDLVFDADDDGERRALETLSTLGFQVMGREPVRTHWWSERIAMSDSSGHVVDLHPVSKRAFREAVEAEMGTDPSADGPFVTGRIASRPVDCLSAQVQLRLHEGYADASEPDRADVALLRDKLRSDR